MAILPVGWGSPLPLLFSILPSFKVKEWCLWSLCHLAAVGIEFILPGVIDSPPHPSSYNTLIVWVCSHPNMPEEVVTTETECDSVTWAVGHQCTPRLWSDSFRVWGSGFCHAEVESWLWREGWPVRQREMTLTELWTGHSGSSTTIKWPGEGCPWPRSIKAHKYS